MTNDEKTVAAFGTLLLFSFEFPSTFDIRPSSFIRFVCSGVFKDQTQRLWCVQPLLELSLQCALGFGRQAGFRRFFPGKLRQDRQLALKILTGNSVPQSVFER